jgi:hypothetical protein
MHQKSPLCIEAPLTIMKETEKIPFLASDEWFSPQALSV